MKGQYERDQAYTLKSVGWKVSMIFQNVFMLFQIDFLFSNREKLFYRCRKVERGLLENAFRNPMRPTAERKGTWKDGGWKTMR